ncbi:hypothetical protein [Candidatus Poriferisodalis sp.]|uniref:hypothetical protein n=1 Tax=Candidatus Poriferisodalis sp. TaxID=3101277 RepID=UPI003B01AC57
MSAAEPSSPPAPTSFFKSLLHSGPRCAVAYLAAKGAMSIGFPWWVVLAWVPIYGIVSYTRFRRQCRREAEQAETFAK